MRGKAFISVALAVLFAGTVAMTACKGGDEPIKPQPPVETPEKTVEETKLTVYEGPSLLESSEKLSATVEGEELFVYDTRVNHQRIFSYKYSEDVGQVVTFDFEGKVHMTVTVNGVSSLTDVVVRPLSYEIEPTVNGNKIEFDLEYSASYTLEYNDGTVSDAADNALHIFANPIEENPIDPDQVPDGVIYIGPGVYSAGAIPMTSGSTVYLAGGAYVYGQIRAEQLENITIRGRGIISGSIFDRTRASEYTLPIELRSCKNVTIEGITILDPAGWAITLYKSSDVLIDNVKIITARANGDGISVQSCSDVTMTGGFVRTWDDSLVVKNTDRGTTSDILFDNVTVWTDLAQSCEVGYETNGATMDDITFRNITILHNYHKAAMSIHNSDDADIKNVSYTNITIEDARMLGDNQRDGLEDYLIDITIAYSTEWSKSGGDRGTVEGVRFDNIKILSIADSIVCRISGESTSSYVQDVQISNVEIEGQRIKNADGLKLSSNNFTKSIVVNGGSETIVGAVVNLPYVLDLKSETVAKTVVPTVVQQGLEVPEFALLDIQELYKGQKLDVSGATITTTHGTGDKATSAYDDGTGDFGNATIANAFDGDRTTAYEAKAWTGEEKEFAAITLEFDEVVSPGVVRVYLGTDSAFVYDFDVSVFVRSVKDDGTVNANYTRLGGSSSTYTATPATGNYFDIKLSASLKCVGLQLRFFRVDGMTGQSKLKINEISFYPSSLSTTKAIVDATDYYDVYQPSYLLDGNESTYWETKNAAGAYFTVDLGAEYNVKYFVMHLPPLLAWEPREQEIEILVSLDGNTWTTAKESTVYLFDPSTGNSNIVELEQSVRARYVKLVWSSNSSLGGYGAQLSELYVYGE